MTDEPSSSPGPRRGPYDTPTGEPCPRTVRVDGSVEGSGNCGACGVCLLFNDLVERPGGPPAPPHGED